MTTINVHPINNETDHRSAMERINRLAKLDPKEGTTEFDELKVWALLVRAYEDEVIPLESPSIKDVVEFRADQMGLTPTDLDAIFGGSGRRSEVLSGKRSLSKSMAARLQAIGVPDSVLVQLLLDREPAPQGTLFSKSHVKGLSKAMGRGSFRVKGESKAGSFVAAKGKRKTKRRLAAKH